MDNISIIRGILFVGFLVLFGIIQWMRPSRKPEKGRWKFMLSNLVLVLINNIAIMFMPLIPYGMATIGADNNLGLFNIIALPSVIEIISAIILLDVIIYFQHRLFHKVNWLWRLHRMHHTDSLLDTTTGLRFHPLEILISNFIKVFSILVLGVSPMAVILFEIILNTLAMFNHSNIKIPDSLEKIMSKVLITPALHTIHHSIIKKETQSNFGFSVP
ncbi:MAG: sterol desaturase family protein [Vallitaleaceae bacterium]|jgi:sterol desaturase/sphingolipid hydroxylase (fatty acid hydroxylase superfamily)|nr:sterol desaturase family protein [Vallitaleaceae bacterium]